MISIFKKGKGPIQSWMIACFFFSSMVIQAQEEEKFIGEVRLMNVVEAQCTLKKGIYEIRFRDAKKRRFPKYASFHFTDQDENYFKLKSMVLKGFDSVPKDPRLPDFTEEKIEIQFRKSAGLASFRFAMSKEGKNKRSYSNWLVKGKAEKLFGI